MEILNQYSGLLSLIAALAAIVIPLVIYFMQKYDNKKTDKQLNKLQKGLDGIRQDIDNLHNDWDEKRKFSRDYDAFKEFQHEVNKRRR